LKIAALGLKSRHFWVKLSEKRPGYGIHLRKW